MSDPPFVILQDVFKTPHKPIFVTPYPCASLTRKVIDEFLNTVDDGVVGVAPAYGPGCVLSILAFASSSRVLLVRMPKPKTKTKRPNMQGRDLTGLILCGDFELFAFHMDILATSLFKDFGLRIRGAVDMLSVCKAARHSLDAKMDSIGGAPGLNKPRLQSLWNGGEKASATTVKDIALRAWVAWRAATFGPMTARFIKAPRIDTSTFLETRLNVIAKIVRDAVALDALKPSFVKNEIASEYTFKQGQLKVTSTRFKNRVRDIDQDQRIKVHGMDKGQRITVTGRTKHIDGRAADITIDTRSKLPPGKLQVVTLGKDAPTNAEAQRTQIILEALQRTSTVMEKPFFRGIWLPHELSASVKSKPPNRSISISFLRPLNASQKTAVEAILSPTPLNVIHGPPGTGKTTVIAAAVTSVAASSARDRTMWLVAQSNVAVKNIAEKLASVDFLDFKLLVSKDFHYDWHEHLYEKINPNLIRSDELVDDPVATERRLLGSKVILCTLTMLSSSRISAITRLVPLHTVIVDEASQVEVGSYLPMINRFSHSLRKLVFIGDDKQLAPYGQSDVKSLQSVFELPHLREGAIFLDTQWMPTRLGTFIGRHVYDNQLKTQHPNKAQCCRFVDVKGKEMSKGQSWINTAEVLVAIAEARKCHSASRAYRIITPYDAQRAMLEKELKASKLPWEDRVFCVDSFQG
ncbi:P-loop containing nucleoside triphosphate hydrolase protein [Mycena belliarum]|uniref:P-loop containing nucleoside triphosphate hydrolase protein n=1 Tax=Mycena belliarum TaxID=1033014 RepID=A0AAD6UJ41_9AGAR|nr:P-loop containing nucleoside triphosphate hydrolase protein [Mycena belliae]